MKQITVTIDNITEIHQEAIEDFLATWQYLGNVGSSRWTSFYADGDGNFRPKILVDGKKPKFTEKLNRDELWELDQYKIDFDKL